MLNRRLRLFQEISTINEKKIIFIVIDGLGGMANSDTGLTELESANLPNIDELAKKSLCGVFVPVYEGVTPGSAPAHLALFGYDPIEYQIGRGVLEALGIGVNVEEGDVVCRANFATLDYKNNVVIDRRAGRISTEENRNLCKLLSESINEIDGVKISITPAKEHRFVILFRGEGLSEMITENDPQKDNLKPKEIVPLEKEAKFMASIVNSFLEKATQILMQNYPANYILMRGFSKLPSIPKLQEIYKINPACIATYPMYKGLARLMGMKILDNAETIEDEVNALNKNYKGYDFFYFHIKRTDILGEDGNFSEKVKELEKVDTYVKDILNLKFDVVVLTGDHSTPSMIRSHSWHPVPILINSKFTSKNDMKKFTEKECLMFGGLGKINALDVMPLALANAMKLEKFGP